MPKQQKNFYKPLIFVLLGSFLTFSVWSAWQAANRGSQITDRDYYSKGLKYNSTIIEKRAAEVLGWALETTISGKTLTFSLTGDDKNNVANALGTLYLYLPDVPNGKPYRLTEVFSGHYQLLLPAEIKGSLRARVMFERDGAKLNRQLQLNL
ncbi:MAG TPA: FixH family protein [Geopsychrobacteraceae bacterium]|nr:FixH family protein [Geopsychrobacteraceae bacterium]